MNDMYARARVQEHVCLYYNVQYINNYTLLQFFLKLLVNANILCKCLRHVKILLLKHYLNIKMLH